MWNGLKEFWNWIRPRNEFETQVLLWLGIPAVLMLALAVFGVVAIIAGG